MKLYPVGWDQPSLDVLARFRVSRVLVSFFDLRNKSSARFLAHFARLSHSFSDIILDSGAYSWRNLGMTEEALVRYCYLLKQLRIPGLKYVSFDVPSSASESLVNYKRMRKQSLAPLPVYHYGESMKYLEFYCKLEPLVCIGGLVGISVEWSELVSMLRHFPENRFHLFGMVNVAVLLRYPWYSADSTTWLKPAKFNDIHDTFRRLFRIPKGKQAFLREVARFGHPTDRSAKLAFGLWTLQRVEQLVTQYWSQRGEGTRETETRSA